MASGTRVRSGGRSRTRGSSASGPQPARSPQAPQRSAAPGALQLKVRSGHAGAFRLQRLVLWQVAAAVLLVGWALGPVAMGVAGVVAAVLVVLSVARRRGGTLPERQATARALKGRSRHAAIL